MKILFIGTTDNKGGAAMVSWELKTGLEKLGHEVYMAVGYKRSHDLHVIDVFDTPLNRFISKIIRRNFYQRLSYHIAYVRSNDISIPLAKKISQEKILRDIDCIHAHNLHSNFFNLHELPYLSHRKPFIWTLHDMWAITGHNAHAFDCVHWQTGGCSCKLPDSLPIHKKNNSQKLWEEKKAIYEKSKLHLVAPSEWLKNKVEKSILKNHPIEVIYNGVDTEIFRPMDKMETRKKLGLPLDKKIILFASKGGSKNIWKGWNYAQDIIESQKNNSDIVFICLGGYDGEKNSENIITIPYINDKNTLAQYYAASDILLYPSIADNCPLTVLEALSSGLPVLAFATGGIPELVENKVHGYIAQYQNLEDLRQGFSWLINLSQNDYQTISSACRKKSLERFSIETMVKNYITLYNTLL